MSYTDIIANNIKKISTILETAKQKKKKYEIVKIMYHNGAGDITEEEATRIYEEMEKLGVPIHLMDNIDVLTLYRSAKRIKDYELYRAMADYANKPVINELESCFPTFKTEYGWRLSLLVKKGKTLDEAIRIFDKIIKKEMNKKKLSEVGAVANLLFLFNDIAAKEFAEAYAEGSYNENDFYRSIITHINESSDYKKKTIHDIKIISTTQEGLDRLEALIERIYSKADKSYLETISKQARMHMLIITDFSLTINKNAHQSGYYGCICLSKKSTKEEEEATFYHEITHFLDLASARYYDRRSSSEDYYSEINPEVKRILQLLEDRVLATERGRSIAWHNKKNREAYINNPVIQQRWMLQIKTENPGASEEVLKTLLEQKKAYERKRYKMLSNAISDIMDNITKGDVYVHGGAGHGSSYYSDEKNRLRELMGVIGELYNIGALDILYYEFGEELTKELIKMYEDLINAEQITNEKIRKAGGVINLLYGGQTNGSTEKAM